MAIRFQNVATVASTEKAPFGVDTNMATFVDFFLTFINICQKKKNWKQEQLMEKKDLKNFYETKGELYLKKTLHPFGIEP